MLVVVRDPVFQCSQQVEGTGPFREPEALFLQGAQALHNKSELRVKLIILEH
jgi:hypothetical protein